jgi:hypothetical protein
MSQRVISGASLLSLFVLALSLQACGGGGSGGGGSAFNLPVVTPAPTSTFSVMTAVEDNAVKDVAGVYAVEQDRVMEAFLTTTDIAATATTAAITFADVNADINDADAYVPEIDAHLAIDGV